MSEPLSPSLASDAIRRRGIMLVLSSPTAAEADPGTESETETETIAAAGRGCSADVPVRVKGDGRR